MCTAPLLNHLQTAALGNKGQSESTFLGSPSFRHMRALVRLSFKKLVAPAVMFQSPFLRAVSFGCDLIVTLYLNMLISGPGLPTNQRPYGGGTGGPPYQACILTSYFR